MPHAIDLILAMTGGLIAALILGLFAKRLGLSPIVGYLVAGFLVGPFTPGFVADKDITNQFAEIGVILLMFGVGLHFHLKDLLAVRGVALPGALAQILVSAGLGAVAAHGFGWSWSAGIVFGIAISVASTVVLTRVLADNRALHTPIGHIAVGWLVVEDLFTILVLVLLPAIYGPKGLEDGGLGLTLGLALLKLAGLIAVAAVAGRWLLPRFFEYVARTGSRELFTLAVLASALGLAVGSALLFGASMALGAFLAGMIVGQSDFGARAASDALPMRDAFAVLFFVSVGMQLDPSSVAAEWRLELATLGIVLLGKPLAALVCVLLLRRPLPVACAVAAALAQIGEFSFILAGLATGLGILPPNATNALVVASVVSITLNPWLFQAVEPLVGWLERRGLVRRGAAHQEAVLEDDAAAHRAVVVGYGPVGRTLCRILRDNGIEPVVVEMNIKTVRMLLAQGWGAVHGDASSREILLHAGIETATGLFITASGVDAGQIVSAALDLHPGLRVLSRADYLREAAVQCRAGAQAVFSGEGEIALSMTAYLMRELGATDEQIDRERDRVRRELFQERTEPGCGAKAAED
ncbi:sodium/hydrogen exchanger [Solidesulfovibrio carbinoliphilus subsp. oakridgensis]|uniref:Sodium/hydrogen exchanger n=1 Tax=Solidesulfovibrio carbinoliphilus subsp. oakridgensis TaxID=694327 RepID=G7Q684_9BACT|nr:cation:proton antiporter [Solidesulfovibrio carbinoliphilus]EHJ47257.1 sodium/hydrogen exchanger [Solidesulfovibrio carbinoliphilus subsp. oakridgensis]